MSLHKRSLRILVISTSRACLRAGVVRRDLLETADVPLTEYLAIQPQLSINAYYSLLMKLVKQCICLGLLIFIYLPSYAQSQFMENIHKTMDNKPKIIFKFDTRKSFIDNSNVTVFGWKVGVEFNKKIRIGGGFNNLTEDHSRNLDKVYFGDNGIDTLGEGVLNFSYICYFVDYVLLSRPKWEISYPIQLGIGASHYRYTDEEVGLVERDKGTVVLLETAITGHYKLTKWFGIGMGVGYRLMLVNNNELDSKFNSPIYIFKLKVFLASIIDSFSKENKEKANDE